MKSNSLIDERLLLAAALFSPVYFACLRLVEKYDINIGHFGRAVIELVTIPAIITPLLICGYALAAMIAQKKLSVWLLLSALCSAVFLVLFIRSMLTHESAF